MYLATKFMETSIRRLTLYSASVRPLNIIIMWMHYRSFSVRKTARRCPSSMLFLVATPFRRSSTKASASCGIDGKKEFEDRETLTRTFSAFSSTPHFVLCDQIAILEKYFLFVYYNKNCATSDLDSQRLLDFEHSTRNNLRLIPPCKAALIEQIKRAAYEGGWISYQCRENIVLPNPESYGWIIVNGKYSPKGIPVQSGKILSIRLKQSSLRQHASALQQNVWGVSVANRNWNAWYFVNAKTLPVQTDLIL